jgi:carbon storage regulator CsrA
MNQFTKKYFRKGPTEIIAQARAQGLFTHGGTAMLVLNRRLGERVVVPHSELIVTVLAVSGKSVRLGFTAPGAVSVYREEVWQRRRRPARSRSAEK